LPGAITTLSITMLFFVTGILVSAMREAQAERAFLIISKGTEFDGHH
jgi:hypothetical protein